MDTFKQTAMDFLKRKDFRALEKFLSDCPEEHRKFGDEVTLLNLVEQGASNERLERPLDNYISKYSGAIPVSNIVTAAKLKYELGKLEEAVELLTKHDIPRENIEATEICVLSLFNLKRFDEGKALVDYLLSVSPDIPGYHEWNILLSYKLSKNSEVLDSWAKFKTLDGQFTQRISTLGFVIRAYMSFGRVEDAQRIYDEHDLEADIGNIDAAMFIADFEKQKGNFDICEKILKSMRKDHPEIPEIQWNLALCQLASGNLNEGWLNYEARWSWKDFSSPKRYFDAPRWDGSQDIGNKIILIWGEQGIGDQLRFLTLLPNLLADYPASRIYLEVDHRLKKLVRTWFPEVVDVWSMGINDTRGAPDYSQFDYQIPSGSLPAIYCNDEAKLHTLKYRTMKISSEKRTKLLGQFCDRYKTIVGISWRSMLLSNGRINDYVNASAFRNIVSEAPNEIGFILLQYAIKEEEKLLFKEFDNVFIPTEDFLSEVDMNAMYAGSCTLLVSCGTVVATMAGIFGIPVVSWCKFDDPVNLGQECNPWFPNRFDIRVMPNWDKVELMTRLKKILFSYLSKTKNQSSEKFH